MDTSILAAYDYSVTDAFVCDRACKQFVVCQDDNMQGQWGAATNPSAKRAQEDGKRIYTLADGSVTQEFSVLVPDGWVFDPVPWLIAGLHPTGSNYSPWNLFIIGNQFQLAINKYDAVNAAAGGQGVSVATPKKIIVPGVWTNFKVQLNIKTTATGNMTGIFGGQSWFSQYSIPTCDPAVGAGFYMETGPYISNPWPTTYTHRKLFMVI